MESDDEQELQLDAQSHLPTFLFVSDQYRHHHLVVFVDVGIGSDGSIPRFDAIHLRVGGTLPGCLPEKRYFRFILR